MMARVALWLYGLVTALAPPLLRRKLQRRGQQEPGYLAHIDERFGRYTQPPETTPALVWIHAVSLGETRTAAILLKALRAANPGLRLLLTHGTATGRAEGAALLNAGDIQVWQPWDSRAAVERFFTHFKPRLGLLMETEIWPNTVAIAKARAIPLVLVNARLSDKSLQQALRLWPLSKPAYAALSGAFAQTPDDAARLNLLGAPVEGVFGNLKFDAAPSPSQQAGGKAWRAALRRPVIMFASSREGEEVAFLEAVKAAAADVFVLIVPRHPQRFDEVAALCVAQGLRVSRRSAWPSGPADTDDALHADVWLGDSLGEMALYYAMADVALLGGSFAPLGGQNLIEAAACGCPVVMGPHTFNFSEAAELAEDAGAALRVTDMAQAVSTAVLLVTDPARHAAAVAAGLAFAQANSGATGKTVAALSARFNN